MDFREFLEGLLSNAGWDALKCIASVVGGVVIAWVRARRWRWVDPLLYGLVTTACLHALLRGFSVQGTSSFDWLTLPFIVLFVVSTVLVFVREWRERTTRTLPREDVERQGVTITPVAERGVSPPLLEVNTHVGQWPFPSPMVVLQGAERLKRARRKIPVKILTSAEGRPIADLLVRIFQLVEWTLQDNPESANYVFPLPYGGSLQEIRLRYRASSPDGDHRLEGLLLDSVLVQLFSVIHVKVESFPDNDAYNFIQIEIGSCPSLPR